MLEDVYKRQMQCQVLSRIDRRQVETGYLYAFHAPEYEVEESKALLTQYYWEKMCIRDR